MAGKNEIGTELNLITAGTVFEGKLRTPGSIRIDGKITGEVTAAQNVSLGSGGDIEGNISAKNVTIGGRIRGMIVAQEKLVFAQSLEEFYDKVVEIQQILFPFSFFVFLVNGRKKDRTLAFFYAFHSFGFELAFRRASRGN